MKRYIVLVLFLFSSLSCENKVGLKEIKYDDVFNQKENRYCVLFYSSSCPSCINTIEILNKRYEQIKYTGFLVNIKDLDITYSKEKVSNLYKENINEIIFTSVPYLVFISNGSIEKELYGYTNIQKENLYIFFE